MSLTSKLSREVCQEGRSKLCIEKIFMKDCSVLSMNSQSKLGVAYGLSRYDCLRYHEAKLKKDDHHLRWSRTVLECRMF